ncbi:MAG: hypothetical protein ACPG61_10275 [Paracoccaceae bacterium]
MSCTVVLFRQTGLRQAVASSECLSGHLSGDVVQLDAYRITRDFPDQWNAYLRAHFDAVGDVALAFGVTDRAARRWWDGAGCRGPFVAIALRLHPDTAPAYLLGDDMAVAA